MIHFFTSIAPFNIEGQRSAINTWSEVGAQIHSINSKIEINTLEKCFPQVCFHVAHRHGNELYGKPYVFLNDIFDVAQKKLTTQDTFILCNSDIHIDGRFFDLSDFYVEYGEIVLTTRYNVPSRDIQIGVDYDCGIDLFSTRVTTLAGLDMGNFCLGVPFWDFWLPVLAIAKGYKIKKLNYPLAIHINHPENYSHENLVKAGIQYLDYLVARRSEFYTLKNRFHSAYSTPSFLEILVHEIIYPTLAMFRSNFELVPSRAQQLDNSSPQISFEMYKSRKYSDTFALDIFFKIFELIKQNNTKTRSDIAKIAAYDAVGKGIYPLYSNFYTRIPEVFLYLSKTEQINVLTESFIPVIESISCFVELERQF